MWKKSEKYPIKYDRRRSEPFPARGAGAAGGGGRRRGGRAAAGAFLATTSRSTPTSSSSAPAASSTSSTPPAAPPAICQHYFLHFQSNCLFFQQKSPLEVAEQDCGLQILFFKLLKVRYRISSWSNTFW